MIWRSHFPLMLKGVNNYLVNEICSHSGSTANELAVLYIAPMVTVGRHGGGGLAVKEACSAVLPLCPHTAEMKWLHPSCWLPVKNRLIWPLSWWQMGAAASFSLQKAGTPGSQICGLNSQCRWGQRYQVMRGYRYTEKMMSSSMVHFSLIVFSTLSIRSVTLLWLTSRMRSEILRSSSYNNQPKLMWPMHGVIEIK